MNARTRAPRASIVIPTFNRAAFARRAIDSALAQTHPCEVVVCDHGSSDETPAVAQSYGDRIRYVRREEDRGPIACWRDGVAHATGDVIQINYDDDWVEPEFMERCVELLHDDVAFVYTRVFVHDVDAGTVFPGHRHPAGIRPVRDFVRYLLRTPLTISPGCAVFRRADMQKNLLDSIPGAAGPYGKNSGVGEDLLLFLLTSLDYLRYGHVPRPLANFTAHSGSITVAGMASRGAALTAAYAQAKKFYWQQHGNEPERRGMAGALDVLRWYLAAGEFRARLAGAVRRFAASRRRRNR